MPPAGLNMKVVKLINGRAIADDYCSHVTAFGFPNRAANRACEASDQLFNAAAQIERMSVKLGNWARGELKGFPPRSSRYFQCRSRAKRTSWSVTRPIDSGSKMSGSHASLKGRQTPRRPVNGLRTSMSGTSAANLPPQEK